MEKKIKIANRLLLLLIFIFGVFTNFSMAAKSDVSYADEKQLTLNAENITLQQAIQRIQDQSEFDFFYKNVDLEKTQKKVSFAFEGKTIHEVLPELLAGTNLDYKVMEKDIVIFPSSSETVKEDEASVQEARQQEIEVSGTVTDAQTGDPLPGVNIVVQGTTTGTTTDMDGNYTLEVPADATLVFSFVGYQERTIRVRGREEINVAMQQAVTELEEVVAIGYGTVKKEDATGAVGSVGGDELAKGAVSSPEQALQGRMAGVLIRQSTAQPGGELSVKIRGAGSITAGDRPLYVVDGVPLTSTSITGSGTSYSRLQGRSSPLNSLNSNDIESIEVLKGASATAIYGSRGANGVVLITTKGGTADRIEVNYNVYQGVQSISNKIDMLTAEEYMEGLNTISTLQGNDPIFSSDEQEDIGNGTDWQDYVTRTAPIHEQNLSVSGGSENSRYFMSLNYFNQEGIVKNTGIRKYIARINLEQTIKDKLTLNLRLNASQIDEDKSLEGMQENEDSGPVNAALGYDPTIPIKKPNGEFPTSQNLTLTHPARIINGMENNGGKTRLFGNFTGEYEILDGFNAKLNLGGDRRIARNDFYQNRLTIHGSAQDGIANLNSVERTHVVSEYTLSYNKDFDENNSINAVGGITYENVVDRSMYSATSGFPSDAFQTNNLGSGDPTLSSVNSNKSEYSLLSYLGRVNYNLYGKYLFTASYRVDGSSRFGKENKFGYFPSLAFGWDMAKEDFSPNLFSQLKLRTSWGVTGNQDIGNYNSIMTLSAGSVWLGGASQPAVHPARKPNPNLRWEETAQLNFGLDYGIFEGRISGSLNYFIKDTRDLLLNLPLPKSSGYSSILKNVGSMRNKGFEFEIDSRNIVQENFTWRSTLNFSMVENEVTDLGGDIEEIHMGYAKLSGTTTITKEGVPLNSYYGYNMIDIFRNEQGIANSAQSDAEPGFPRFEDKNGDGNISPDDRMILGKQFPDFTYGLRNVLSYKNWRLDFFIQGEQGADLLNLNFIQSMFPANFRRNRYAPMVTDQWTPENKDADWPIAANPYRYEYGKVNNRMVQDASFARLKDIELSYRFGEIGSTLQSARIYVKGQNIFTITDYEGYNPETNLFGSGSNARMDWNAYPMSRVWMLGIDVTF